MNANTHAIQQQQQPTAVHSGHLVDEIERKMAAWLAIALADLPAGEQCPLCTVDRDTLGLCLKQAYLAGVEAGMTSGNSCSPYSGILHDAKDGLLIRN